MLNHFNARIVTALALLVVIVSFLLLGSSLWYLLIPFVGYIGLLTWASYSIGSNFFLLVVCKGNTTEKKIALTFDDGPHEVTADILAVLTEYNVKATFFCIGQRVEANPQMVKQLYDEGHTIGNHSYSHARWFSLFNPDRIQNELEQANRVIQQTIGKRPHYFRPPYGVTNPKVAKAVRKTTFATIGWSVRSLDTTIKDPAELYKRVTSQLKPGAIVLFHDTQHGTVSVLRDVLKYCRDNGYTVVPLPELINVPAYE